MGKGVLFGDVLDAADNLSPDEQETLIDILRHRKAERQRQALVAAVDEARQQFQLGQCRAVTPDELMKEILS